MPAEEAASPNQEAEIKTEVASPLTNDEAPSEPAEALRGQRQAEPTKTTAHEKVSTSEQPVELVSQATVQKAEKAVADGTTAAEIDVALPDLEGAAQDKTTGSSVELEADVATTRAEGGDVSSDADDQDGRREGTRRTRASRQSRRADAEPTVFQKTEGPSSQGSSPQETMSPEAASATETAPEQAEANLASPDLDPGLALAEEHVVQAATEQKDSEAPAGRVRSARGGLSQSRVVPAAWLRAVLGNARQSVFADGGWKVLEMKLDDGDGTVTIKAKREDGRVAVAVGFSDPGLRALASAHADRLQELLQAKYDTAVDFSLFSNDAGHSDDQQHAEGAGAPLSGVTDGEGDVRDERPARRPLPVGAHHEWVG